MSQNITMKDIANKLKISIVTVSKALSDKPGVSESLRKQIKKTAKEMGYRCNTTVKSIKEGFTNNIGVIVAQRYMEGENSFYSVVYGNIAKHLIKYGYYAILEIINRSVENKNELPMIIINKRVDALIILGQVNESYIQTISKHNIPIIFFDFYDRNLNIDSITGDNIYNAYTMTNYLIDNNHREIGYIGNIYCNINILDKYLGYSKALIENNIKINQEWIINDRDRNGEFCDLDLSKALPTAFVCNCDETAYYFIRYLNRLNIKVPDDISIVGFDNDIHSKISNPSITTIQVNIDKIAKEISVNIIKKISDEDYKIGNKVIVGDIIIRESVNNKTKNLHI